MIPRTVPDGMAKLEALSFSNGLHGGPRLTAFEPKGALQQSREFSAVLQRGMMLASHVLKFRKSERFPQRPLRVKP